MTMSIERFFLMIVAIVLVNTAATASGTGLADDKGREVKTITTTTITKVTETRIVEMDSVAPLGNDTVIRDGGKLMWVPDSLTDEVRTLVKGHSRVVDDPLRLDINEMTVFKGDTIPMVLKDRNLGRYDRGLFNFLFIPKGSWHFGLTVSYGEFSIADLGILNLVSDIDVGARTFAIRPFLSYFIRNNLSLGVRFGYTNARGSINSLNMDIDEDMSFSLHDIGYRQEDYTAAVTLQQYVGLSRRGRFGVYNEVELSFTSGSSDFNRPYAGVLKQTHTTNMEARLTFSPGVCVFIMENVSFNLSFGVFGFYIKNERQTVDGEPLGNRFTSGANFKINLFNLAFGIGVHI